MGTRGYNVWRFRKRYYKQFNPHDSYPDGLGRWISKAIPSQRENDYVSWLQAQRNMVEQWESSWENPGEPTSEEKPSWFAPLNDLFIEFVYIIDLDREIFSINNSVHLRLDQICHLTWIGALADAGLGDEYRRSMVLVPGFLPEDTVTSVVESPTARGRTINTTASQRLPRSTVKPKDITSFPWRQRHGTAFYHDLFAYWSSTTSAMLAVMLLQWTPDDPPFREIAFATLCLALGGSHVRMTTDEELGVEERYQTINGKTIGRPSVLDIGADDDTDCVIPESAPRETIYWLEGVLIILASQLFRSEALDDGVSLVVEFRQNNCAGDSIEAILMSIEHVVLIHILPGIEVQHTALLPLISISDHLSMHPQEIFTESFLQRLARRKQASIDKEIERHPELSQEDLLQNQNLSMTSEDSESDDPHDQDYADGDISRHLSQKGVEGSSSSTFYALMHIFETAARRRLPPARPSEGRLPTEIYSNIIAHVTDVHIRRSCLKVSNIFRTLCQENVLVTDGRFLRPWDAREALAGPDTCPVWFYLHEIESDEVMKVGFRCVTKRQSRRGFQAAADMTWKVGVGNKVGEKSLLDGFQVGAYVWG